jgi:acetyl-CoA carboxylase, biotin carboxyl carrier protein
MDYKAIINLMKEMNQTDLTKVEIEEEGVKICLEKAENVVTVTQPVFPQSIAPAVIPAAPVNYAPAQTVAAQEAPAAAPVAEAQAEETGKKIVSPMVGTFYGSPSPDKPAFVKVGDKVKKGQTVCIIEAMKLMNEIESEFDGEVVKILASNEQMVEFGQPLFVVK